MISNKMKEALRRAQAIKNHSTLCHRAAKRKMGQMEKNLLFQDRMNE